MWVSEHHVFWTPLIIKIHVWFPKFFLSQAFKIRSIVFCCVNLFSLILYDSYECVCFDLRIFIISTSEKFNTRNTSVTINLYSSLTGRCDLPPPLNDDLVSPHYFHINYGNTQQVKKRVEMLLFFFLKKKRFIWDWTWGWEDISMRCFEL